MTAERIEKLKEYLQNLIIKKPGEHYNLKEIVALLAALATIGGGLGMLGGPIGSGIGAGAGLAVGGGIIITIELVNAYRLHKMNQQPEEEYYVVYSDNNDDAPHLPELVHSMNMLELDDTDTQSSEETIGNNNNSKTQHKPLHLEKAKASLAKLTCKLGLHKHKDPLLYGLTQEENILQPVKLGKR